MNNSLNIINDLIKQLNEFENQRGKEPEDIKEFLLWINQAVFEDEPAMLSDHDKIDIDMELTFLLIMQSKYYKQYCKEIMVNTEINSPDEYSFLYHLSLVDSFRKMELINIHLLEAPSGIEVIKRLLKKGFIEEFDDKDDKRAKRVSITQKGLSETKSLDLGMQKVYSKMAAGMTTKEKLHMISNMRRLTEYHNNKNA